MCRPDAYLTQLEPHRRSLEALARSLCGPADAEDLAQESLLKAWRKLPQFEGRSSLRRWLYALTTRVCLDAVRAPHLRAARRGDLVSCDDDGEGLALPSGEHGPDEEYDRRESVGLALAAMLERLPPRQRAVLLMREVLGLSAQECAERLATTVPAVNSALQRARSTIAGAARADLEALQVCGALEQKLRRYLAAWSEHDALTALLCTEEAGGLDRCG